MDETNFNITITKEIDTNLNNFYNCMTYLNIANRYILTFGGCGMNYETSVFILEIKDQKFYKSKITLPEDEKFYRSNRINKSIWKW